MDPWTQRPVAANVRPEGSGAASATSNAGTVKENRGNLGFILQDSGEKDMFVMPGQCAAFDNEVPPVGTRVLYDIGIDGKSQRPIAINVQSAEAEHHMATSEPPWKKARVQAPAAFKPAPVQVPQRFAAPVQAAHAYSSGTVARGDRSGTMKKSNGKSGFIQQDSGEADMFVLPLQCRGFDQMIPEPGTRVIYMVGTDPQKGKPIAENVRPEGHPQWSSNGGATQHAVKQPVNKAAHALPPGVLAGTVKQSNEKYGFILQDSG